MFFSWIIILTLLFIQGGSRSLKILISSGIKFVIILRIVSLKIKICLLTQLAPDEILELMLCTCSRKYNLGSCSRIGNSLMCTDTSSKQDWNNAMVVEEWKWRGKWIMDCYRVARFFTLRFLILSNFLWDGWDLF